MNELISSNIYRTLMTNFVFMETTKNIEIEYLVLNVLRNSISSEC